jgi:hypothetical protein
MHGGSSDLGSGTACSGGPGGESFLCITQPYVEQRMRALGIADATTGSETVAGLEGRISPVATSRLQPVNIHVSSLKKLLFQ